MPAPPAASENSFDENELYSVNTEITAVKSVQFYDSGQQIIGDVNGWYNFALLNTILLQWETYTFAEDGVCTVLD